jgi:hypothetical protein
MLDLLTPNPYELLGLLGALILLLSRGPYTRKTAIIAASMIVANLTLVPFTNDFLDSGTEEKLLATSLIGTIFLGYTLVIVIDDMGRIQQMRQI